MIDITKKWKTRNGRPVTGLHTGPDGVLRGSVVLGIANVRFTEWDPASGRCIRFGTAPFDLVPAGDEPATPPALDARLFLLGARVRKKSGSWWEGVVVGHYSTEQTPDGVCVQLERPNGPVQIYPASAMEAVE